MKIFYSLIFCLTLQISHAQTIHHWETIISANDVWSYHAKSNAPGENWKSADFDDSDWQTGQGGIGYGDGDDETVIETVSTLYLRKTFNIINLDELKKLILHIDYDDAFVAYLNGIEIARSGISGTPPSHNQLADLNHEAAMYSGGLPEIFLIEDDILNKHLINGQNALAIQIHNKTTTSSDMSALAWLSAGISNDTHNYKVTPDWFFSPFVNFESTNLPLIEIKVDSGNVINDSLKVRSTMRIIDNGNSNSLNDSANIYFGNIGIETRGHYSSRFPQKPYSIETRLFNGENRNVPLWDMPKENDWILLANYNEKTFVRNSIAFDLFRQMGHYAPRTKHCELILNGDYQGIYVLTEKIKRDDGRVDIAKLKYEDTLGDQLTGGYIFKVDYSEGNDKWNSKYYAMVPTRDVFFIYQDPKLDELNTVQSEYIESFVDSYESVLYSDQFDDRQTGYHAYINDTSFIDYFIVNELSRNCDGYKKSKYYHKDKDSKGGRINSGPVWDYDWAFKNRTNADVLGTGWMYPQLTANYPNPDGWIVRLMADPLFRNKLHDRYYQLRESFFNEEYIFSYIDSVHTLVDEAQQRHYKKWDILGKNIGTPEKGDRPTTYAGELDELKEFITRRFDWLDENMSPFYTPGLTDQLHSAISSPLRLFPNPASDYIYVEDTRIIKRIDLLKTSGKIVKTINVSNAFSQKVDVHDLQDGIYLAVIYTNTGQRLTSRFVKL